jgi:hypothetical protein
VKTTRNSPLLERLKEAELHLTDSGLGCKCQTEFWPLQQGDATVDSRSVSAIQRHSVSMWSTKPSITKC